MNVHSHIFDIREINWFVKKMNERSFTIVNKPFFLNYGFAFMFRQMVGVNL